ncbi:MAG: sugar transferase [Bacteroidota bacterium]
MKNYSAPNNRFYFSLLNPFRTKKVYLNGVFRAVSKYCFKELKEEVAKKPHIVEKEKLNDVGRINAFLKKVNHKLPLNGYYIGCADFKLGYEPDQDFVYQSIIPVRTDIFSFLIHRIFSKIHPFRKIYLAITKGKRRRLSKTEILGRLFYSGFDVLKVKEEGSALFYIAQKIKSPEEREKPTIGPVFTMNRVGKNGKKIKVYKLRTMHPYASYVQEYVFRNNDLKEGGKFDNDFRISPIGKFLRKYFLDELPMIINIFKGEMKIVGVRPLSAHYLSLYSKDLQEKRLQTKPGLLPPFYVDMPKTLEEVQESELKYLNQYEKNPLKTDIRYFLMIIRNIIFRKARSN